VSPTCSANELFYFLNRKQYVIFNDSFSSLQYIQCGVPQGSILGPLLVLAYIDNIQYFSKLLKFVLITDITMIFFHFPMPNLFAHLKIDLKRPFGLILSQNVITRHHENLLNDIQQQLLS